MCLKWRYDLTEQLSYPGFVILSYLNLMDYAVQHPVHPEAMQAGQKVAETGLVYIKGVCWP